LARSPARVYDVYDPGVSQALEIRLAAWADQHRRRRHSAHLLGDPARLLRVVLGYNDEASVRNTGLEQDMRARRVAAHYINAGALRGLSPARVEGRQYHVVSSG
jgi:hypothetical protein